LLDREFGATREARPCDTSGFDLGLPFAQARKPCTFYGQDNERSSNKQHLSAYAGSNFSKKIQFNGQVTNRWGHFDLDFGNGNKYPRVSPGAIAFREARAQAIATGECDRAVHPDPIAACVQEAPLDPGRGSMLQISGGITFQPTNELRTSFSINKQRLRRYDTGRIAFDVNIVTTRATYQFTKATFARVILDYNTLNSKLRSQALFGWTPSPGTAFYAGYNDDSNYDYQHPFTGQIVPGFRRNSRTLFIKMSYLIRKGF